MGSVILYIAFSPDKYIATPEGGVEWPNLFEGTGEDYGYSEKKGPGSADHGG